MDPNPNISMDEASVLLGVSVPNLRKMRAAHLTEGQGWIPDPDDSRRILLTPEGVQVLRTAIGLSSEAKAEKDAPAPEPEAARKPVVETMTVVSCRRRFPNGEIKHFANPRVIQARRANGEIVFVRVAESRNFIPKLQDGSPMTLEAMWDGEPPNWSLVGRCPRFEGRY
ncbi:MAG: hypothetical protein E6Q97_30360 [Desulfurellales bacterium]|nr:MAG: hypothetical protein E6Q97_30360 [Desulfurellales bacterium]